MLKKDTFTLYIHHYKCFHTLISNAYTSKKLSKCIEFHPPSPPTEHKQKSPRIIRHHNICTGTDVGRHTVLAMLSNIQIHINNIKPDLIMKNVI